MGKIHEKIDRPRQENAQATHRLKHNKKEVNNEKKKNRRICLKNVTMHSFPSVAQQIQ